MIDSGSDSEALLSADGPVAKVFPDFIPRRSQQQMAALVEQALSTASHLIVEVPSGSGKTLAYLLPIFAQNKKAIISTATHFLQNQLYRQDIPLLQRALSTSRRVAVLKGRLNYLCPYYLEKYCLGAESVSADNPQQQYLPVSVRSKLLQIRQKFTESNCGEIALLATDLDAALLPYLTCSNEECLGNSCPRLLRCPLMLARQQAQQADIVIVNHSLLFSDRVMRREQLGGLLPDTDVVIIDEAHRLASFTQSLVGERLSSQQLSRYCRDALWMVQHGAPEQRALLAFFRHFQQVISDLKVSLPALDTDQQHQHSRIIVQLLSALARVYHWIGHMLDRDASIQELSCRTQLLEKKLQTILSADGLCWIATKPHGFVIQNIPLTLSHRVRELIDETAGSWIFTSATLSVAESEKDFSAALGLQDFPFYRLASEINYQQNAMLYLPDISVEPEHSDYPRQLARTTKQLFDKLAGRCLFLFSSHRALNQVAICLQQETDVPLFVQGSVDNMQLIERFKAVPKGILLGTGSFWEGLDLSGVPLVAVIIDRLPFASPDEPLIRLRSSELNQHGVDSFQHYLLPDAVLRLRQGCGRLLRRLSDRGVIMLADPRLRKKNYGQVFFDSLPDMPRCSSLAEVTDFFNAG
jgi:ATP-dependent DNA helicase DinG